jgi:trimeric autotransporter adhesin
MNEMSLFNGSVITPAADTAKPQVTGVQVTGQNTAKITLSEAINEATVAATLQKGATQTGVSLVKDATDTTGKTYTLTVDLNGATAGDGIFSGTSTSETFTLYVAAGAMTDTLTPANANELFNTNLTFVKDVTAPALVSSQTSADSKKLEFKFNEDLTVVGSDANIIIKNADGVRITAVNGATETALKTGDNKTYQVDTKAGDVILDAGTYTVTIPAGFFTDGHGNASTAVTSTFTVGAPSNNDTVKPTGAVTNAAGLTNVFEIAYSEEVTSTALNVSNYKLDGASLPAGTEIYFTDTDKDTVRIVLPAGSINIGNQVTGASAILTVSGVADKAGNVINTANTSVVVKDNTAASITNVQVLGSDVYVTFNENITVPGTTNALDAFKVTVNGTVLTLATDVTDLASVTGNAKQVKFSLTAAPAATPVVTVKSAQAVLTDANGVAVK